MSKAGEIAVSQSLLFSAVISRLIRRRLTCTAMKKHWLNARTGGFYGVLLYAASREPRRGETPVTRASAVPAAALAWGSSVEYRQQRKSKKAAPQGAVPPRYGAAFSALRQKYGDRPPPLSLFRHPFSSLLHSSERPAFTPSLSPGRSSYLCRKVRLKK